MERDLTIQNAVEPFVNVVGLVGSTKDGDVCWTLVLHPVFANVVVKAIEILDNFGSAMGGGQSSDFFSDAFHLALHVLGTQKRQCHVLANQMRKTFLSLVASRSKVGCQSKNVLDLCEDGLGEMETAAVESGRWEARLEGRSHGSFVIGHHLQGLEVGIVALDDIQDFFVQGQSS